MKSRVGLTSCGICEVDFIETDAVAVLECPEKHFYHKDCINRRLADKLECPLCSREEALGKAENPDGPQD